MIQLKLLQKISGLKIQSLPLKLTYKQGEVFNLDGLKALANYDNQTTALISNDEDNKDKTNQDKNVAVKTGDNSLTSVYTTIALLSIASYTMLRKKDYLNKR